jgi:hypothetical protein
MEKMCKKSSLPFSVTTRAHQNDGDIIEIPPSVPCTLGLITRGDCRSRGVHFNAYLHKDA